MSCCVLQSRNYVITDDLYHLMLNCRQRWQDNLCNCSLNLCNSHSKGLCFVWAFAAGEQTLSVEKGGLLTMMQRVYCGGRRSSCNDAENILIPNVRLQILTPNNKGQCRAKGPCFLCSVPVLPVRRQRQTHLLCWSLHGSPSPFSFSLVFII
jgi:hypothetical protein